MSQPSKRVKLIAAVVSPLLFLGLLEGALRLAGYRYQPAAPEWTGGTESRAPDVFRPHPELIWTLARSTVIDEQRAGFVWTRTNSFGLRGEELPGVRPPEELLVLCLGDSVTFGLGVPDEYTYPFLLERELESRPDFDGRPVRVVSGAVPGWSTVQGMRLLDRLSWLEPDVVVFWFGMNDVQDMRGIPDSEMRGTAGGVREALSALDRLRTVQLIRALVDALTPGPEGRPMRVSREEFAEAVAELERREAEGGPEVVFVRYPHWLDLTVSQLEHMVGAAEEAGVEVLAGPGVLLDKVSPGEPGAELRSRVATGPEGPEIRFGDPIEIRVDLATVRESLATARDWRRELEARHALLPEDAIGAEELFGDTDPSEVFSDNVHLVPKGNRLAAKAIADRIVRLVAE